MNKNDSRRKLLKSLAAGSGAVVAGKTLPESWTKPVIDTVMLPAHAETTGEECPSLTIPGDSANCGEVGTIRRTKYYYVDDTGECPELKQIAGESPAPSPPSTLVVEIISRPRTDLGQSMTAYFIIGDEYEGSTSQLCGDPQSPDTVNVNEPFKALSGAQWMVTGTLSRDNTSVTVSTMTLIPPA